MSLCRALDLMEFMRREVEAQIKAAKAAGRTVHGARNPLDKYRPDSSDMSDAEASIYGGRDPNEEWGPESEAETAQKFNTAPAFFPVDSVGKMPTDMKSLIGWAEDFKSKHGLIEDN